MRTFLLIPCALFSLIAQPASGPVTVPPTPPTLAAGVPPPAGNDEVLKRVDDLMWHVMLDDIAHIDKVEYTSLPPARTAIRERPEPAIP